MQLTRASFLRLSAGLLGAGLMPVLAGCTETPVVVASDELRLAWWGAAARSHATEMVIEAYERTGPGVTISSETTDWAQYWHMLAGTADEKGLPDVFQVDQQRLAEFAARGDLYDLGAQREALDLTDIDPTALANAQAGGLQVAVPTGVRAQGILLNARLFRQAGIPLPDGLAWTWSDYRDIARQVQEKSPQGTFGAVASGYESIWAVQREGGLFGPGGVQVSAETLQAVYEFERRLIDEKAAPDAALAVQQAGVPLERSLFVQGKVAMLPEWSSRIAAHVALTGTDYAMVPLPRQDDGSGTSGIYLENSMNWCVSSQSKDPAAAARFLAFLLTDSEASAIMGTDRGVPPNAAVRKAMRKVYKSVDLACLSYIGLVADRVTTPVAMPPAGAKSAPVILEEAFARVVERGEGAGAVARGAVERLRAALAEAAPAATA